MVFGIGGTIFGVGPTPFTHGEGKEGKTPEVVAYPQRALSGFPGDELRKHLQELSLGKTMLGTTPPASGGTTPSPVKVRTPAAQTIVDPAPPSIHGGPSGQKTLLGVTNPFLEATKAVAPLAPIAPAAPAVVSMLPTEEEARQNPHRVVELEPALKKPSPVKGQPGPVEFPKEPPSFSFQPEESIGLDESIPLDLPPPAPAKPVSIPTYAAESPSPKASDTLFDRLLQSSRGALELFHWSLGLYLRFPQKLFLLGAMIVLPVALLSSSLQVAVATVLLPHSVPGAATVDFSRRKAELADRLLRSQAEGHVDSQAAAELAALTSVDTAAPTKSLIPSTRTAWVLQVLLALFAGFLLSGLAYPLATAALGIATADRQAGADLPAYSEVLGILGKRGLLLAGTLLPAALLTSLGYIFFVIPGLVLSVLLLFVPHVVLFEKEKGLAALWRSFDLVRRDVLRIALFIVAFALAAFFISLLLGLFAGPTGSRAAAFVRALIGDLMVVAVLPIPSLALGRVYLELRKREGVSVGVVARSART